MDRVVASNVSVMIPITVWNEKKRIFSSCSLPGYCIDSYEITSRRITSHHVTNAKQNKTKRNKGRDAVENAMYVTMSSSIIYASTIET